MIKILFVCHGNICRSPMAEFVMKDLVNKKGMADQFLSLSKLLCRKREGVSPVMRLKIAAKEALS